MLAALGFITVIAMLILIMTKKASPAVALIIVPLITGIIACALSSLTRRAPLGWSTSRPMSRALEG